MKNLVIQGIKSPENPRPQSKRAEWLVETEEIGLVSVELLVVE